MEGAPNIKKEVREHLLLKDEAQNSMRRRILIKKLQENYMEEKNRVALGLSTRETWVCHLGTNSGSPEVLRVMESQVAVSCIPLSTAICTLLFSHSKVSGFREQVTVSRNLSIKASLLLLYINLMNDFLVTDQEKMKKVCKTLV